MSQALASAQNQRWQQAAQTYLASVGLPLNALRGQSPAGLFPTSGAAAGYVLFDILALALAPGLLAAWYRVFGGAGKHVAPEGGR